MTNCKKKKNGAYDQVPYDCDVRLSGRSGGYVCGSQTGSPCGRDAFAGGLVAQGVAA